MLQSQVQSRLHGLYLIVQAGGAGEEGVQFLGQGRVRR